MDYMKSELLSNRYKKIIRNAELYEKLYCHNHTPLVMSILVTNRCTLRCKHCFNHMNSGGVPKHLNSRELGLNEYEKISKSMGSFMKALFSGGEPFIREDLKDIVLLFAKNNNLTHISITTNGQDEESIYRQTEYILSKLQDNTNLSLGFSLEGFEEVHDYIRGKGTYQKAMCTWKKCSELRKRYKNFDMYICSTMNTLNESSLCDFFRWGIENLCPDAVALLKVRQNPRDGEYMKNISLDNYYKAMKIIEGAINDGKLGDTDMPQTYANVRICEYVFEIMKTGKRSFNCFAGKYGGFINYNGDVGACEILDAYGNLREYNYNFMTLWEKFLENNCKNTLCDSCTHETEGIIPSMYLGNNK